ncbi:MAG TPA: hypothetical protein P5567_12335 [Kiritimatiellia bacterium]|nr:hypothetical protein [Kiritimatiellia bacterium]HRZ13229.1 hypothetical protein [Kiritimatiellia bacterium]HSA18678.1 hypothetical protein [Kiritimatiellia bacterium]
MSDCRSIGRPLATSVILALWAAMMLWLARAKAFPDRFGPAPAGYPDLLAEAPAAEDSWMRLIFRGRTAGYARRRIETQEHDPAAHVVISYQLVARMTVWGVAQDIRASAEASLDAWHQLQGFSLVLRAGTTVFRAEGRRAGASTFDVELSGAAGTSRLTLEIPDEAILYSPLQQLLVKRLSPGQRLNLKAMDPFSFKPSDWTVEAESWENIEIAGRPARALALRLASGPLSLRAWMDENGRILREESALGWTLEACEAAQALSWAGEGAPGTETEQDWGGYFDWLRPGDTGPKE